MLLYSNAAFALLGLSLVHFSAVNAQGTPVFINEFHYDNSGTPDTNEYVEIAGPAGTDLDNWELVLYNGSDGTQYGQTTALNGIIPNQQSGFGTLAFKESNIMNGSPDGICLFDGNINKPAQFISYEGTFKATNGPCNNTVSVDVGVEESGELGEVSLQLRGTGTDYEDFTWFTTPYPQSFFFVNAGQHFPSPSSSAELLEQLVAAIQDSVDEGFDDTLESLDTLQESVESINTTIADQCTGSGGSNSNKSSKGSSGKGSSGKGYSSGSTKSTKKSSSMPSNSTLSTGSSKSTKKSSEITSSRSRLGSGKGKGNSGTRYLAGFHS